MADQTQRPRRQIRTQGKELKRVVVAGIDIPFWDMLTLFLTAGVAAIPAFMILSALAGIAMLMLATCGAVVGQM